MGSGNGCMTMWIYLMPPSFMVKTVKNDQLCAIYIYHIETKLNIAFNKSYIMFMISLKNNFK